MAKGAKKITKEGEGLPITPPKLSFIQKKLLAALYSFFETEPKDPLLQFSPFFPFQLSSFKNFSFPFFFSSTLFSKFGLFPFQLNETLPRLLQKKQNGMLSPLLHSLPPFPPQKNAPFLSFIRLFIASQEAYHTVGSYSKAWP